jgi:hypothetical protein
MITRPQIEGVPLSGRNFLELAKFEPGAQQPTKASNNRTLVPLLGAPVAQNGRATRVTVDGGSVMEVGNGGAAMGFSEEVVQEFQVSTANFDLSTGATASGADHRFRTKSARPSHRESTVHGRPRLTCRNKLHGQRLRHIAGFVPNDVHVITSRIDKPHPHCVDMGLALGVVAFTGRHGSRRDDDQAVAGCVLLTARPCFARIGLTETL